MNEFKFSTLRQFGSENVSFTATIHSESTLLTDDEIAEQIEQIDKVINTSFIATNEREIKEKDILAEYSGRRKEAVAKLDESLKVEIKAKKEAEDTLKMAEKISEEAK